MRFFETNIYFEVVDKIESQLSENATVEVSEISNDLDLTDETVLKYYAFYLKYIVAARLVRLRLKNNRLPANNESNLEQIAFEDLKENQEVCVPLPGFIEPFRSFVSKIDNKNKFFLVQKCSLEFSSKTLIQIPL